MKRVTANYKPRLAGLQAEVVAAVFAAIRAERERNRRAREEGRALAQRLTGMPDLFDLSVAPLIREMDEEQLVARLRKVVA